MKYCSGCETEKSPDEFWKNQGRCKECRREYDRNRYQRDPKRRKEVSNAWRQRQVERIREIKAQTPCADCQSQFHPVAMQFDHISSDKEFDISSKIGHVSMERLLIEIAKCEIVCANCHAVRTYARQLGANG